MTPARRVPIELGVGEGNKPHYWKSEWVGDEKVAVDCSSKDIDCAGKMSDREFMV